MTAADERVCVVLQQMRSRVYPAPAAPMGLMHGGGGGGGGGAGYAPPRFLETQPGSQLSLQVRYPAQPGYQPPPYRHPAPPSLTVSTEYLPSTEYPALAVPTPTVLVPYRGAPRIFSRGGLEQKFSYLVASKVRNINLT